MPTAMLASDPSPVPCVHQEVKGQCYVQLIACSATLDPKQRCARVITRNRRNKDQASWNASANTVNEWLVRNNDNQQEICLQWPHYTDHSLFSCKLSRINHPDQHTRCRLSTRPKQILHPCQWQWCKTCTIVWL